MWPDWHHFFCSVCAPEPTKIVPINWFFLVVLSVSLFSRDGEIVQDWMRWTIHIVAVLGRVVLTECICPGFWNDCLPVATSAISTLPLWTRNSPLRSVGWSCTFVSIWSNELNHTVRERERERERDRHFIQQTTDIRVEGNQEIFLVISFPLFVLRQTEFSCLFGLFL